MYLVLGSSANITYTGNFGIEPNFALILTISDSEYPSTVIKYAFRLFSSELYLN
ncbi:hypothetical protein D3C73_1403310 [compost metagenome]